MIHSDLKRMGLQVPMTPGLKKALAFLRRPDIQSLPDGRYEIDGARVFALVQRYETITPAEPKFEAHRKYIDVQFIAAGAEIIGCAPLKSMTLTEPYDEEKDICFGLVAEDGWTPLRLEAGRLAVLYPEDAHAPKLAAGFPATVIKVVVKVAV